MRTVIHLCFRHTTYDNINGPGMTTYVIIFGPAGPLMYPDQISRYRPSMTGLKYWDSEYQSSLWRGNVLASRSISQIQNKHIHIDMFIMTAKLTYDSYISIVQSWNSKSMWSFNLRSAKYRCPHEHAILMNWNNELINRPPLSFFHNSGREIAIILA